MNYAKDYPICGIYMVVNQITGDRYIGQSRNIIRRYMEHTCKSALNKREGGNLHSDIEKMGKENFYLIILDECEESDLDSQEVKFIKLLKPEYNKCDGGKGVSGAIITEEKREKNRQMALLQWQTMDEEKKQKIKKNLRPRPVGFRLTEEQKERIRQSRTGIPRKQESIEKQRQTMKEKVANGWVKDGSSCWKKVVCVTTGEVFESVKSAGEHFGLHPSSVTVVLKGRQKSTHGLIFKYAEV